jgi:hypothetical protein
METSLIISSLYTQFQFDTCGRLIPISTNIYNQFVQYCLNIYNQEKL